MRGAPLDGADGLGRCEPHVDLRVDGVGVVVIALVTATGGGTIRDLLRAALERAGFEVSTAGAEGRYPAVDLEVLDDPSVAEIAFIVADEYQGRGIGTLLLAIMWLTAFRAGAESIVGYVLAENRQALSTLGNE